jgi:hypothetical protein
MWRRIALVVLAAAIAIGATAAAADADTSANWAGYVVNGTDPAVPATFTRVSARWVQPKAVCTGGGATYSAFWVGLGGSVDSSQALEQIGTEADCSATGKAKYAMWYELVPAASVRIKYKVFPGNVITASVGVNGTRVTVQIRNLTRRTKFTKVFNTSAPDTSSAEWVAESPSACDSGGRCVVLPLTNFGAISFNQASATANQHAGSITDPAWTATPIQLVSQDFGRSVDQSQTVAVPSDLAPDGTAFSVSYQTPPS